MLNDSFLFNKYLYFHNNFILVTQQKPEEIKRSVTFYEPQISYQIKVLSADINCWPDDEKSQNKDTTSIFKERSISSRDSNMRYVRSFSRLIQSRSKRKLNTNRASNDFKPDAYEETQNTKK